MTPINMLNAAVVAVGLVLASAVSAPAAETLTADKVKAALPRLEAYAQDLTGRGVVPGMAIAIVYKDEVVYLGGFGVRALGSPEPVDADTVFQLASFSKPMAAATVAAAIHAPAVPTPAAPPPAAPAPALVPKAGVARDNAFTTPAHTATR